MKENQDNQDIQTENEAQQLLIEDINIPEKKKKKLILVYIIIQKKN